MRLPLIAAALLLAASAHAAPSARKPAVTAPTNPDAPHMIGKFDEWVAATHLENGQTVCYAFTRAANSTPAIDGRKPVVLTVAERPTQRDSVAIAAGFVYPARTEVTVQVDQAALSFYTSQTSAFAIDGPSTVAAFQRGKQAFARSNGPRGTPVADTFSLKGFVAAYAAVVKACPIPR